MYYEKLLQIDKLVKFSDLEGNASI